MSIKNILSSFSMGCIIILMAISCSKSGGSNATDGTSSGGTDYGAGTGGTAVNIDMSGMTFLPASVTVKVGTTVKWTNSDGYSAHTVTSNDGVTFNSGNVAAGAAYSFKPTVAGTFLYHCNIHAGMNGTLMVTN